MKVKDLHAYLTTLITDGHGDLPVKLAEYHASNGNGFERPVDGFTTASRLVFEGYEDFLESGYARPDEEIDALRTKFAKGGPNDALYLTVAPGNTSLQAPGSIFDAGRDAAREYRVEE